MAMEYLTAQKLEASLFTTSKPDAELHLCVVPIDKRHAASFYHGPHSILKEGEKIILYNVTDSDIQREAVVKTISYTTDIVVFELVDQMFPCYPNGFYSMFRGQSYRQLGINEQRMPKWKEGTVSEMYTSFFVGASHGRCGDSGSGIFDHWGRFLGISVEKKDFKFVHQENMPIAEVANHYPETKIIPAQIIFAFSKIVNQDPFEPVAKKIK